VSPEEREAVIEGFRQRVVVPSNDGSMPSSDIQACCASERLGADDAASVRAGLKGWTRAILGYRHGRPGTF
jgi:hypothetical protein